MPGLPKKYIKQYGVSKKAWAAYRKDSKKRKRTTKRRVVRTKVRKVAKRRSYRKKVKSFMDSPTVRSVASKAGIVLYGGLRARMSNALSNSKIGRMMPATRVSDELLMYGAAHIAGKLGARKIPIVGSMVRTAKTVELARIGEELFTGGLFSSGGNSGNSGELF